MRSRRTFFRENRCYSRDRGNSVCTKGDAGEDEGQESFWDVSVPSLSPKSDCRLSCVDCPADCGPHGESNHHNGRHLDEVSGNEGDHACCKSCPDIHSCDGDKPDCSEGIECDGAGDHAYDHIEDFQRFFRVGAESMIDEACKPCAGNIADDESAGHAQHISKPACPSGKDGQPYGSQKYIDQLADRAHRAAQQNT